MPTIYTPSTLSISTPINFTTKLIETNPSDVVQNGAINYSFFPKLSSVGIYENFINTNPNCTFNRITSRTNTPYTYTVDDIEGLVLSFILPSGLANQKGFVASSFLNFWFYKNSKLFLKCLL